MKKLLLVFAASALVFASCKKDDPQDPGTTPQSTEEKIIGDWNGDEQTMHISFPPLIDSMSTTDISWLHVEFLSSGKVYVDSSGIPTDTSDWAVINDNSMTIDGDTFAINTLTTTNFNFGFSETELGATATMEMKLVK